MAVVRSDLRKALNFLWRWRGRRFPWSDRSSDLEKESPKPRRGCNKLHGRLSQYVSPSMLDASDHVNKATRLHIRPCKVVADGSQHLNGSGEKEKALIIEMAVDRHRDAGWHSAFHDTVDGTFLMAKPEILQ
jgi:hypothetical protein